MNSTDVSLSTLVASTPHILAYTIPSLFLSILLTFAGTFLTLDRTRTFPSSYASIPLPGTFDSHKKRPRFNWELQGGVGGLASGYLFGLHLSTFLALLIPAISSSAPLAPNTFLAVWILAVILTTILSGRYRYCAFIFSSISGGALLALAISVIIHPALHARQVLVTLFSVLSLALVLVFSLPRFFRFLHPTLRTTTSSAGAFSLVLTIALLAHIPAWANVWERLWLTDSDAWGTPKERGLSAAFCVFTCAGICTDWLLNRWIGECPDEKWDSYLADYAANPPNDASRAGVFKPFTPNSFWARLFHPPPRKGLETIPFPSSPLSSYNQPRNSMSKDAAALLSYNDSEIDYAKYPIVSKSNHLHSLPSLPSSPGFLKKGRSKKVFKPSKRIYKAGVAGSGQDRKRIKFDADASSDSSDSDSYFGADRIRPWLKQKASLTPSSSSPTLVDGHPPDIIDYDLEIAKLKGRIKADDEVLDYSDYEEDIGARKELVDRQMGWRPEFMERHSTSTLASKEVSGIGNGNKRLNQNAALPMGAVPATPSLIKALDRVSAAQQEAYGIGKHSISPAHTATQHTTPNTGPVVGVSKGKMKIDGIPKLEEIDISDDEDTRETQRREIIMERTPRWEEFWKDVNIKAGGQQGNTV